MRLLFICRGNVGRSQIAEAIFSQIVSDRHYVQSAGVEAMGSDGTDLDGVLLKDRASSKYAIEAMKDLGVDISNKRIKRLTPLMVQNADKIIAILKPEAVPDFVKSSGDVTYWDIVDPDEQSLEFYKKTRDEVKEFVKKFIELHKLA
jgi:protein-tyrosine-phosphatase